MNSTATTNASSYGKFASCDGVAASFEHVLVYNGIDRRSSCVNTFRYGSNLYFIIILT